MNNIYVDGELPKSCKGCLLHNEDNGQCQVLICYTDDVPTDCPLKPLTDRLAEERKIAVQEIRDLAGDYFEMPYCDACGNTDFNDVILTGKDLTEILDDVERGE